MKTPLSYLQACAARVRFCEAYALVLEAIARVMVRYGITSVSLQSEGGPACHNVCDRGGLSDRIVRITVLLDRTGHYCLVAAGESGQEYPLGLDIDGQDDWSLSSPVILLDAVSALVARYHLIELESAPSSVDGRCRPLHKGDRVRWADPAIGDFDPGDRPARRADVYTILDAPDHIEEDSIILISDGVGETEALPGELALAYEP